MKFDGRMLGLSTFWASHWSPRVKNRTPWSGWQLGCSCWWVRAFIHSIFCCETFNVRYYNDYTDTVYVYISHSIILRHQVASSSLSYWFHGEGAALQGFCPKTEFNDASSAKIWRIQPCAGTLFQLCCASGPFLIPFLKWIDRKTRSSSWWQRNLHGICTCRQRSNEAWDFAAKSGTVV